MKINILIGGKAGQGANAAAILLGEILTEYGYYVFNYRDYPSLIRGGNNFNIIAVSNRKIKSQDKKVQLIVALDENTIKEHKTGANKNTSIVSIKDVNMDDKFKRVSNVFFLGLLIKILGLPLELLIKKLEEKFKGKKFLPLDKEAAESGYNADIKKLKITKSEINRLDLRAKLKKPAHKNLKLLSGSDAIAKGAIKSGIDIYLAYPMTPATPVLHLLAGEQEKNNITVFLAENEIAVANAALGSSHTGARTMIGTSGGGYDLMTEAMSMQGISEIPLVVYLAQRPGPGSGVPTYTGQGDLNIALNASHGEFPRIVIAPGDAEESIICTNEAFYFAEKYRLLSVLLGDKHVSESQFTYIKEPKLIKIKRNIDQKKTKGLYNNYKITKSGNSKRSVPSVNIVKSTSYEHDEKGITIEDAAMAKKMYDKRLRKEETLKKEVKKFQTYKIHGRKASKNLIVGWGSTKGAIVDAIHDIDAKFLQLIYIKPFPKEIKKYLENSKKVILVENNATGLLGREIRKETGFEIKDKILRYDGRPFEEDTLKEQIIKILK